MKLTLTPSKKSNENEPSADNDVRIHEGSSYQAHIPKLDCKPSTADHDAILFWKPTDLVSEQDLTAYISHAKDKHRMNEEQALAILQICKYKIVTSELLMEDYVPETDQWTVEEKFLFEQAYKYYGKTFLRIKQMLPEKSVAELVRYYYSWKKTRLYKSLMDKIEKQCQLMPHEDEHGNGGDEEDEEERNTTSISLPTKDLDHRAKVDEQECCNCEVIFQPPMHSTPKGVLCDECFLYWQKSGLMRPELYRSKPAVKKIKRPPKNLSLELATFTDTSIEKLEEEIQNELTGIQSSNQQLEQLTSQARDGLENLQIPFLVSAPPPPLPPPPHAYDQPTSTWSTEEILLAIQSFAKYGRDFPSIARIIGATKSVADIEKFYGEYRERYQLDMIVENYYSKARANAQQKSSDEILFC